MIEASEKLVMLFRIKHYDNFLILSKELPKKKERNFYCILLARQHTPPFLILRSNLAVNQ